ncbi:MAG: 50S ribosomal protein L35ae [Sulfolobales archaeon]
MSEQSMNPIGQGIALNYKMGKAKQPNNYLLVKVVGSEFPKVDSLIGCRVLIRDEKGNEYRGKIVRAHSRKNNIVVVRMSKNIPGQLLGTSLVIFK